MARVGLTESQLNTMRTQAANLMPDTCTIQTVVNAPDGAGGHTESWSDGATVACRLDIMPARTRTEVERAQEARTTYYRLTIPYDTNITVFDRVKHEDVIYQIAEVHPARSWEVVLRATIVRVN